MTASIEEQIETALFSYLAEREFVADIPLAWEKDFTPPNPPAPYVRVKHHRNRNQRFLLRGNDPHLRRGILQLTVVVPLAAGGSAATSLAGTIAAQFPADLAMYGAEGLKVVITKAPDVDTVMKDDISWTAVISVPYRSLA